MAVRMGPLFHCDPALLEYPVKLTAASITGVIVTAASITAATVTRA
jgi:hypothetical protein